MFTTQYLSQPDQSQQTPLFDVKNSPLALLAQTCNSIGKDVVPFSRTLPGSTSTTFSVVSGKGHDDPAKEHRRCSSEDDVTSTMMTSSNQKARDLSRRGGDLAGRKNSTSSDQAAYDDDDNLLDVVGLSTTTTTNNNSNNNNNNTTNNNNNSYNIRNNSNSTGRANPEDPDGASEPLSLISKPHGKSSAPKSRGTPAVKLTNPSASSSSSSSSASSSGKRNRQSEVTTKKGEGRNSKGDGRNSKDHHHNNHQHQQQQQQQQQQRHYNDHNKRSDSWLLNLPFKQNAFAPPADGIHPGYFNFFPADYSNFLKNYYCMSQVNAHQSQVMPLFGLPYPSFSEHLNKPPQPPPPRTSPPHQLYSFSPLQSSPHSPSSSAAAAGIKPQGDVYGSSHGKPMNGGGGGGGGGGERNLPPTFLSSPVSSNPLFQSSKDLQNLSYMHFLSQHNPMLMTAHAPLACPLPFRPIGESCSKLFSSFDDVMDHVKLHWAEGKDSNPPEGNVLPFFPPFAYNPLAWSLKAFDESQQQVGKKFPAPSSRFHPYVKPFLSNHVP